jgi:hypothetical protein
MTLYIGSTRAEFPIASVLTRNPTQTRLIVTPRLHYVNSRLPSFILFGCGAAYYKSQGRPRGPFLPRINPPKTSVFTAAV